MNQGMTWNVIGQSVAVVFNQILAWGWTLFHLPMLAPPSAEFEGAEQLLAGLILWMLATREHLPVPNGNGVLPPPVVANQGQQGH